MSKRYEISWVPYATQRPEYQNQYNYMTLLNYTNNAPIGHLPVKGGLVGFTKPTTTDTFFLAGNASANMDTTGLTLLGVSGVDDGFAYMPLPFNFFFFGTNYSNASAAAPSLYWNTNQVIGFGTGNTTIAWAANTGNGILLGNTDRRTNTFYYSGLLTSGNVNYLNMVYRGQNIFNDGVVNAWQIQYRIARSPNYQYLECRLSTIGATSGTWNITNGTAFQNTYGAYTPVLNTSFVLRSDLNGNNWTFSNNYYLNF